MVTDLRPEGALDGEQSTRASSLPCRGLDSLAHAFPVVCTTG